MERGNQEEKDEGSRNHRMFLIGNDRLSGKREGGGVCGGLRNKVVDGDGAKWQRK